MNTAAAAHRPVGICRWLLGALLGLLAFLGGCRRGDFPQDTPDAVLATARKMVQEKRADLLPNLIYADSKDMRKLLDQFGQTLGSLQDLAFAVNKAYPDEIAKLQEEAEAAAKNGQATSFIQKMVGQASQGGGGRRRRGQPPAVPAPGGDDDPRKAFNNAAKELFADPYGWLTKTEGRLTTQTIADDTAAILWDGKPVFGVGLMMKQEKGKWYVVLPTNAPGLGQVMPKSPETWEIMGGLLEVFDNALTDLTKDVKKGRCKRLEDVASKAGEKAFVPAVMVFFAYSQAMEAEKKEAKARAAAAKEAPAQPSSPAPGK